MDMNVYFTALSLSFSQIVGIGPQNAYVLRQGIGHSYVTLVVLCCVVSDVLLISCGVFGAGKLISAQPGLMLVIAWAGAAAMFWLGYKSLRAGLAPQHSTLKVGGTVERDLRSVLRTLMMVCLLNPYALLDTIVLIGGVSAVYGQAHQQTFLLGCATASLLWFVLLGIFSRKLAPLFEKPISWRVLDSMIGGVMVVAGVMLLIRVYGRH